MSAVIVTRPQGPQDPLVAILAGRGLRVHAIPTVATVAGRVADADLEGFDWIVVTSAAGVAALPSLPRKSRWAAVGRATADALADRGVEATLVPMTTSGLAIAESLPDPSGLRILLARAELAASDLPDLLRSRGAEVTDLAVYRTIEGPPASRNALTAALGDPSLAAVVFASGSAARGFVNLGGPTSVPAVTIGPRTSRAAQDAGFRIIGEAAEQTTESLAAAVVDALPEEASRDA